MAKNRVCFVLQLTDLIKHRPWRSMEEWRYSLTHSYPLLYMEVSGQSHAPATLIPDKQLPVSIGWEAELAPKLVWTQWRKSNPGRSTHSLVSILTEISWQPVQCVHLSISAKRYLILNLSEFTSLRHYSNNTNTYFIIILAYTSVLIYGIKRKENESICN